MTQDAPLNEGQIDHLQWMADRINTPDIPRATRITYKLEILAHGYLAAAQVMRKITGLPSMGEYYPELKEIPEEAVGEERTEALLDNMSIAWSSLCATGLMPVQDRMNYVEDA